MPQIRARLKELRNADVRYISLVDRAATRIPFRVLKRNKEHAMGIDLTKVFKSENRDAAKPFVSALVVFAQKDEAVGTQVQDVIKGFGFDVDKVQKSDEGETLVYAQGEQPEDAQIVRLGEQVLASVSGLQIPTGWIGDFVEEHGFFPDLKMASAALHDQMVTVAKSDTPQDEAEAALTSYAEYLNQIMVLPAECFKIDEAIADIVKKCSCEEAEKDEDEEETAVKDEETEEERKKRQKRHPPAEMAPADEDADQEPPPPEEAEKRDVKKKDDVKKSDPILKALKGIETTVAGLATKLETVVTEQAEQKKVLDDVVQKADTLNTTLKTTVTAPPVSEDRPSLRMRVQKQDDDPRTGNFDTAFLRRRK